MSIELIKMPGARTAVFSDNNWVMTPMSLAIHTMNDELLLAMCREFEIKLGHGIIPHLTLADDLIRKGRVDLVSRMMAEENVPLSSVMTKEMLFLTFGIIFTRQQIDVIRFLVDHGVPIEQRTMINFIGFAIRNDDEEEDTVYALEQVLEMPLAINWNKLKRASITRRQERLTVRQLLDEKPLVKKMIKQVHLRRRASLLSLVDE